MTVDTKGTVVTPCKDIAVIAELFERAIYSLIREERALISGSMGVKNKQFVFPTLEFRPITKTLQLRFKFKGEERMMSLFLDCDSDAWILDKHPPINWKALVVSMGAYGDSVLLVKTVLHALSILGTAYIDENDCDDSGYSNLNEFKPTFVDACLLGYIHSKQFMFDKFKEDKVLAYPKILGNFDGDFDKFLGFEESQCAYIDALDKKPFKDYLKSLKIREPGFKSDYHESQVLFS